MLRGPQGATIFVAAFRAKQDVPTQTASNHLFANMITVPSTVRCPHSSDTHSLAQQLATDQQAMPRPTTNLHWLINATAWTKQHAWPSLMLLSCAKSSANQLPVRCKVCQPAFHPHTLSKIHVTRCDARRSPCAHVMLCHDTLSIGFVQTRRDLPEVQLRPRA